MKKTTGKVVSLVLALALVVTSFSGTFAFAASKTVSGTLSDTGTDEIYLVNGGSSLRYDDLQNWIFDGKDAASLSTKEHHVESAKITSISHSSGDKLVKWDIDENSGDTDLTLRSSSVAGTEVLSILYKATYTDDDNNTITVKASKNFTVHVLNKNSTVIGVSGVKDSGKAAVLDASFAQKTVAHETNQAAITGKTTAGNDTKSLTVFQATTGRDAKVVWQPLKTASDGTSTNSLSDVYYTIKSSNGDIKLTNGTSDVTATVVDGASSGSINFTAQPTAFGKTAAAGLYDTKDVKVKSKIDKQILVDDVSYKSIGKYKGKTYLYKSGLDVANNITAASFDVHKIDISGFDVNFKPAFSAVDVVVADSASVSKISGKVQNLKVNEGSVSTIDLDAGNVLIDTAKAGDITTDGGNVTVSSNGTTGKIDATNVEVRSGKTGDITADDTATVNAVDDDVVTNVGAITAKTVAIDSNDSKVTTGALKATSADSTFTLAGGDVTVKSIDFDYYGASLNFNDFQGTVPAPVNATATGAQISTTDVDDKVTVTGNLSVDNIDIADESKLTLTGTINATDISGSGTLVFGAGKLYVGDSLSGVILKLSDSTLAKGTVVMTAAADCVSVDDATPYGFTLAKTTGKTTDTFKIDTLVFAGLSIDKTSATIAKGYSETFTASAYPGSTSIPKGYTVDWSLDGNDGVFALTVNPNGTATVKAVDFDSTFASENKATLVAKLLDADGDEDDSYSQAETQLTAIAKPDYISDTNKDISVVSGKTYQFKITSSTAPRFTLGTDGIFTIAPVVHPAGTNDYYYTIKATGKVGAATGVYINDNKLIVATVSAPAFKSDTTGNVTVKGVYTVKITADAVPNFVVGTAGVFNAQFVKVENKNEYYYRLTSVGKAGAQAGIFVNGVKTFVATVG